MFRAIPLKYVLPLLGLTVSAFIFNTSEFMPIGLLMDISQSFAMTESQTGIMITVYAWVVALLSLPLMLLVCQMEMRRLLLGTMGLFVLGQLGPGTAGIGAGPEFSHAHGSPHRRRLRPFYFLVHCGPDGDAPGHADSSAPGLEHDRHWLGCRHDLRPAPGTGHRPLCRLAHDFSGHYGNGLSRAHLFGLCLSQAGQRRLFFPRRIAQAAQESRRHQRLYPVRPVRDGLFYSV